MPIIIGKEEQIRPNENLERLSSQFQCQRERRANETFIERYNRLNNALRQRDSLKDACSTNVTIVRESGKIKHL